MGHAFRADASRRKHRTPLRALPIQRLSPDINCYVLTPRPAQSDNPTVPQPIGKMPIAHLNSVQHIVNPWRLEQ